jgi:hypothetical protein
MKDLAQKTKRKNARKLKNIFRSKVPLSSIKSVNGHIKGKVYRRSPNPSTVILDKKVVGRIKRVDGGWQYFPKGQSTGGDIFPSVGLCKQSLED